MRLQLEAEPQELKERGHDLLKALACQVHAHAPELAEALEKALPSSVRAIPQKALRQLQQDLLDGYVEAMREANEEVLRLYSAQGQT